MDYRIRELEWYRELRWERFVQPTIAGSLRAPEARRRRGIWERFGLGDCPHLQWAADQSLTTIARRATDEKYHCPACGVTWEREAVAAQIAGFGPAYVDLAPETLPLASELLPLRVRLSEALVTLTIDAQRSNDEVTTIDARLDWGEWPRDVRIAQLVDVARGHPEARPPQVKWVDYRDGAGVRAAISFWIADL